MNRSQWAESLAPGIRKWVDDAFNALPQLYPEIFHTDTSSRAYEEDEENTGIGYLEERTESSDTPYESMLQGYKTRYTHTLFKKGIKVSKEEYDDDQYRIFKRRSEKLGKAAKRTYDYQAMSVFRNAFNTAKTSYGDAKPLASTSHPRQDGGTSQSNASSTGIQLTDTNLETALLAAQQVVEHKGQIFSVFDGSYTILVPLALRKAARIIVGSDLKSGTANNDMNVYKDGSARVIATRWISALAGGLDTQWHLLDDENHMLNFFMREAYNLGEDYDFDTDTLKVKARTRFSYGWSTWFGTWHSKGNLAAYSS